MTKVKIIREFRDKDKFSKVYTVGEEVDVSDETRVKDWASKRLIEIAEDEPTVFGTIDLSKPAKEVIDAVAAESEVGNLTLAQEAENAKDNPRKTVVKAIDDRIVELNANE